MPINVPDSLPAIEILKEERIFIIQESKALHQDIRAMRIALLNIMPVKQTTETHILRLLSNTPLQIEMDLIYPKTHKPKNTPVEYLQTFYKTFDEIIYDKYDGMIITGAPVELLDFEEVDYWYELKEIMDWTFHNVTSSLFICWAAQAGLYHFFDIPKYSLNKKMFGVFKHKVNNRKLPLVRGFDDTFLAPHSRHTEIRAADINKIKELEIVSESDEAGVYIVAAKDGKQIFITGHSEYDPYTLKEEYERDIKKGINIQMPENYFMNDDINSIPVVRWRSHANLLFTNWLNYYVYQKTPYNLNDIK
ncbi:MAG: homoserine O-succinyltransferase [Bacteroidales bacterium]|nr:MAG: homoserine O-succinyltransferase [Bacteroidales bacterium]